MEAHCKKKQIGLWPRIGLLNIVKNNIVKNKHIFGQKSLAPPKFIERCSYTPTQHFQRQLMQLIEEAQSQTMTEDSIE